MKVKDLKEILETYSEDLNLVLSQALLIDKKDEVTAIVDCPIVGIADNVTENELELRFVLYSDDFKACFPPENLKIIKE